MNAAQGFRPLHDWVVIEPRNAFRSGGVIALPEAYDDDAHGSDGDLIRERNELCLGVVVAVGPGAKVDPDDDEDDAVHQVPLDLEVGQQVMYHRATAQKIDGTDPLLVRVQQKAVFLIVEGDVEQVVGGLVSRSG